MFPVLSANTLSGAYNINNSLRFRRSASSYLSRTPSSNGNRQKWTWSAWVKLGSFVSNSDQVFAEAGDAIGDNYTGIRMSNASKLLYQDGTGPSPYANPCLASSDMVFRDPSAWYHIVVAVDTTQATSTNRVKIYVNGSQIAMTFTATYPQNANTAWNSTSYLNNIGKATRTDEYTVYSDHYQAEVNFIDGQQLTPSSFGSTNATTGVWQPARYTGTYGTNGFYLNFSDIATTSGSNAGLGKDFSGNGNYFNTTNISVTAGTTYDAMIDSPTLTSATVGNYCVWNPVAGSINTISNGNLTYSGSTGGDYQRNGTLPVSSGKWYYETVITTFTGADADMYIGFSETSNILNNTKSVGNQANQYSIYNYASATYLSKVTNSTFTTTTMTKAVANDVLMFALDLDNNKIWFGKNGTWIDSGNPATGTTPTFSSVTAGSYVPGVTLSGGGFLVTLNSTFGQRPFTYTPPTGFNAWNTYNLPDSTIVKGNTVMDATLYTGTGSSLSVTNAAAFKPDLVWIKSRSAATDNKLTDSVRGATKAIISNTTGAETTDTTGMTAFNTNGFTVGASTTYNNTSATYVGWQWQAGQGSTSSNTSGSITSTVSVNTTAGFSVVTYTGNGTSGSTIGHGLGVAPKFILIKRRQGSNNWAVAGSILDSASTLYLNLTNALDTYTVALIGNIQTSTTFQVGNDGNRNESGGTFVAYCWAEIAGFSKFGSYTGNGSADGPFVYLGFRPKYVMVKPTSAAGSWQIEDTARSPYNVMDQRLFAEDIGAEVNNGNGLIDYLSNGFKPRVNHPGNNGSGATYIYMAFAENPFKNALAR